jgi:hypothetical protein
MARGRVVHEASAAAFAAEEEAVRRRWLTV